MTATTDRRGQTESMGTLWTILVVLVVVALILFIVRRI